MGKLNGKVAIVTGSGQGIGKGIAICLAKEGAKVVLATRTVSRAEDVQKEIKALGGESAAFSCDVKDKEQVKATVKFTIEKYGTVDILVNNAQQFIWDRQFEDYTDEDIDMVFNSGYKASFWFMKECFSIMKEKKYGKIINMGSAAGIMSLPGTLAYASNKEAIRAMSRVAAREWGQYGIFVNCIAPVAETVSMTPAQYDFLKAGSPLRRVGTIEDIGKAAVFLASSDSDYTTGTTLFVDGGFTIDTAR